MIPLKRDNRIKLFILTTVTIFLGFLFFTFKITSIPPGLETDEGSISYNSALISNDLKDQNHRFLPFFILSSDRIDWKQPVLIYFTTVLFKLFGKSIFVYKLSNVILSLTSGILLAILVNILFKNKKYAFFSFLIYITTPIIFITTRIGNESLLPSLISSIWLLTIILYQEKTKPIYLILNAFSLGIGFYSFKGMRLIVPIWSIISFITIIATNWDQKKTVKKNLFNKNIFGKLLIFLSVILPFYLISPILETKYPGAVFDRRPVSINSLHEFFYYWLSNISLSSWFTTPDIGRVYTVASFGAVFLTFMPIFIIGVINAVYKKDKFSYILICFILTPSLFSLAQSIKYPHRLIASIPFIIILTMYGFKYILRFLKNKPYRYIIYVIFSILLTTNIFSFYKFYFINYPKLNPTQEAFGKYTLQYFLNLSEISRNKKLTPYIQESIYLLEGDEHKFYNLIYFNNKLNIWKLGEDLPNKSVLLTENSQMDGFSKNDSFPNNNLHILIKE